MNSFANLARGDTVAMTLTDIVCRASVVVAALGALHWLTPY
jgi:hypothetical protein